MKKLLLLASFMICTIITFGQKEAKLTVEVSNDSILLGNYIEVKFTIENASVENFEAPNFDGFNIVSGPNQSSSMMINNGEVTQSVAYSYYIEPIDIGNYYIQPAFVDTGAEMIESNPIEVLVVDNPDGIIQQPQRQNRIDFFGGNDIFGGDNFFGGNDLFEEFFDKDHHPFFKELRPKEEKEKTKKKKKRKVYKL